MFLLKIALLNCSRQQFSRGVMVMAFSLPPLPVSLCLSPSPVLPILRIICPFLKSLNSGIGLRSAVSFPSESRQSPAAKE